MFDEELSQRLVPKMSQDRRTVISIRNLRKAFDCPIGAYAEAGHAENPKFGASPDEQFFRIETYVTPEEYAGFAREWKKTGAQIIGGCCATTPEYIEAIRPVVKE